jgi:GNAT superfamily N-acetyltransferase
LIEKVRPVDVEEILLVINTSNREAYKSIIPKEQFKEPILTLEELLKNLDKTAFYAHKSDGKIVGVAALDVLDDKVGKLRWVYVLPEHQRKGIGTALITLLEQKAVEKGLRKMRLRTIGKSHQAVNFYKQLGYKLTGKIEEIWGYDFLMEKVLRLQPFDFSATI